MTATATPSDYRALLAQQDWATLSRKLKLYAYAATGSRSMARAEDLAQEVVTRVWTDDGVRWDPAIEPSVFRFLTGLLRGDLSNERRLKRTSHEILAGDEIIEAHGDGGRGGPEALLLRSEAVRDTFAALRASLPDDPIGLEVAELFERGVDGAADQAAATGRSIDDIRRARRRVFDRAAAIARRERETEEEA